MRAAVFHEEGKPLSLEEVPYPERKEGEVILKVRAAGLCHGDVHLVLGEWSGDLQISPPVILGHEIVGDVVEGGKKFKDGDRVILYSSIGCGKCKYCLSGKPQFCERVSVVGVQRNGGFAEYVSVPEDYLFKVDGDPIHLAPLADAGITAYSAVKGIKRGDSVAVIGTGAVAMIASQMLKSNGADVIMGGRNPSKLAKAEEMGIPTVMMKRKDNMNMSQTLFSYSQKKFDYVLDFVGSQSTLQDSMWLLSREGELRIVGEFGGYLNVPEQLIVLRGLKVKGVLYGSFEDMNGIIKSYQEGKFNTMPVPYKLEEINDAINDLIEDKIIGRAVITPSSD
ncbi:alcohol dehydrogenase catalytic domain-containing protein [Sulfuracidifex tepidarius]|nr:alcohol dehydrogenase catalytic domain-containing protein [Sulfuracidifex tepidarius]